MNGKGIEQLALSANQDLRDLIASVLRDELAIARGEKEPPKPVYDRRIQLDVTEEMAEDLRVIAKALGYKGTGRRPGRSYAARATMERGIAILRAELGEKVSK
jgi:hypothetical protein